MLIPPPSSPIEVHMVFLLSFPTLSPLLKQLIKVHPCFDKCKPLATPSIMVAI
jgi:hypothetical protein